MDNIDHTESLCTSPNNIVMNHSCDVQKSDEGSCLFSHKQNDAGFGEDGFCSDENDIEEFQNPEEIDELLEKPIGDVPAHLKTATKVSKRVLMYRGQNHFDVLPDGWVEVTHNSGLPVYLHKKLRCCTFSRPYFLGPGSVRCHNVPESAIPCLFYEKLRREMENNEQNVETQRTNQTNDTTQFDETVENGTSFTNKKGDVADEDEPLNDAEDISAKNKRSEILNKLNAPKIKIKTANDLTSTELTADALHEYAQRRIKFKNINIYRFSQWRETRDFHKDRKRNALQNSASSVVDETPGGTLRPGLSSNVLLITVPAMDNDTKPQQKPFCINPQGKTSVCILHDLAQKVLRCSVDYFFDETRNSAMPYSCVAKLPTKCTSKLVAGSSIKDRLMCIKERYRIQADQDGADDENYITIGEGLGNSKKHARMMAAKKAVENLLGGLEFDNNGRCVTKKSCPNASADSLQSLSTEQIEENKFQIFDNLGICDSRVSEWSARAGQPAPYLILQEYLRRNAAFGDTEIRCSTRRLHFKRHRFDMYVGQNHHVSVDCLNKREGKQKAAQAMLKKFLPESTTWGSILRLYGYEAQQKQKEAVKNKESIIKLQGELRIQNEKGANSVEPNNVILDKLKSEMMKLSSNLVEKKMKILNSGAVDGLPPMKRARLESAAGMPSLSATQIDALEALLHAQKCRLRNETISYSEMPILSESQMCELSAKLAQIFPDSDVKVPSLS